MFTMSAVTFACGVGLGIVFASMCMTASILYDSYIQDKRDVEQRKAARRRLLTGECRKQLPEPKVLYIEHKQS